MYADPVTGLYTMVLARKDYDEEDLLVIDGSNIVPESFEFSRTSWEMTKNTIIVQYTDRDTFEVKPVQYQDLANIDVRGGMIDSEEISFLGFSNDVAAMNAAARASKVKASPLVSCKFSLNRIGYQLRPGSVFVLRKPDRGLTNVIMRVIELSYGTLDEPEIKVTAMEDIFAVNAIAYEPPGPGDWTPPVGSIAPLAQQALVEAPLFGADDSSRRYIITLGVPASGAVMGYDVWSDPTGGTAYQQTNAVDVLTPSGVLQAGYSRTGDEVDEAGFTITAVVGAADIEAGSAGSRENGENLLLIGNELIAWRDFVNEGGGVYTVKGNYRGVLDTMPEDHAGGARVFFLSEGAGVTDEEGYAANVTVRAKLLPKSIVETVDIAAATSMVLTTNNRAQRPLPPGRLRINGAVVGPSASITGSFTFSWAHRNRFDETIASQADPSRTPEEGVTYNIRIYTSSNALLASALDVSNAASSGTAHMHVASGMRIELEAVRDGYVSWTKLVGHFSYTPAGGATDSVIVVDEPEYVLDGGGA